MDTEHRVSMNTSTRHIYLFSDATGETVERVLRAALSQFRDVEARVHRMSKIRTREDILSALEEVLKEPGIVVYTLVDTELAQLLRDEAEAHGLDSLDLISSLLFKLSDFFEEHFLFCFCFDLLFGNLVCPLEEIGCILEQ